jgi:predicted nucleic acid-binding Zn ribbon protein
VPDDQPDRAAAAAAALAKAKAAARARGTVRPGAAEKNYLQQKGEGTQPGAGLPADGSRREDPTSGTRPTAGLPAGRVRRDDPAPLNAAISGLVSAAGWELAVAAGSVFGRWAEIVGPALASHTTPESLNDGVLVVASDSTAWAEQVRLLASDLVRKLNAELGDGAVLRVHVHWSGSRTRQPGQWRVKGSRGDRDTYG